MRHPLVVLLLVLLAAWIFFDDDWETPALLLRVVGRGEFVR